MGLVANGPAIHRQTPGGLSPLPVGVTGGTAVLTQRHSQLEHGSSFELTGAGCVHEATRNRAESSAADGPTVARLAATHPRQCREPIHNPVGDDSPYPRPCPV